MNLCGAVKWRRTFRCHKLFHHLKRYFLLYILAFSSICIFALSYASRVIVHIQCPCWQVKQTEERVQKYLVKIMRERQATTNRTIEEEAEFEHPFLPVKFLTEVEQLGQRCRTVPGLFEIRHRNSLWQEADIGLATFLLFSAYADYRDEKEGPLVRILAFSNSRWPLSPMCQFYTNPDGGIIKATKALRVDYIHWQYPIKNQWYPYLITCRTGSNNTSMPKIVSLVTFPCSTPTNALKIKDYDLKKQKENMTLCHKFLFNPTQDNSLRLIEWLEAARAWGVNHVTIYVASTHPNVQKVLNYYQKIGFMELVPWSNPGTQPNIPSLQRALFDTQRFVMFTVENIPYTDCLLRHIGTHRYVGIWDIDEFPIPIDARSIPAMVDAAHSQWQLAHDPLAANLPSSYAVRSSYFFSNASDNANLLAAKLQTLNKAGTPPLSVDEFRERFLMLGRTTRSVKFSPPFVFTKAIHDTRRALALHAHFALFNLEGRIDKNVDVVNLYPQSEGFLAHFRDRCQGEDQTDCDNNFRPFLTQDATLWHHGAEIIQNSVKVSKKLNLV